MRIDAAPPTLLRSLEFGSTPSESNRETRMDRFLTAARRAHACPPDSPPPQTSPLPTSPLDRRRTRPERPADRAVGAAIVAGGPPLSVLLYSLPDGPRPLDPFQPEQGSSTESAKVVGSTFHDFPDIGADRFLDLVTTYGLPDVVKSLQLAAAPLFTPIGGPNLAPPDPPVSAPDPHSATPPDVDTPSSSGGGTDVGPAGDSGGGSEGSSGGGSSGRSPGGE
jgi:uncharacterized membrane protein YgcG